MEHISLFSAEDQSPVPETPRAAGLDTGETFPIRSDMEQDPDELSQLLEGHEEQMSLDMVGWQYDEEVQAFIPAPVREYPPTDYRRLADNA